MTKNASRRPLAGIVVAALLTTSLLSGCDQHPAGKAQRSRPVPVYDPPGQAQPPRRVPVYDPPWLSPSPAPPGGPVDGTGSEGDWQLPYGQDAPDTSSPGGGSLSSPVNGYDPGTILGSSGGLVEDPGNDPTLGQLQALNN